MIAGNLAQTPFAHLLIYVREHRLSGTLAIWPEGTSDEAVANGEAKTHVDRLYFAAGSRKKGRVVDAASTLERALLPLFQRPNGPFVFYPDADYVGDTGVLPAAGSDLALISASTRGPVRDDVIDAVLSRFLGSPVRIRPDADLRALELLPREQVLIEVLRAKPAPVVELVDNGGMDPRAARKLLYLLAITKTIEVFDPTLFRGVSQPPRRVSLEMLAVQAEADGGVTSSTASKSPVPAPRSPSTPAMPAGTPAMTAPRRSLPPPAAAPLPPAELSREHRELWDELASRVAKLDRQNFFEMLGLEQSALGSNAREAYFAIVKRFHPDRLPAQLAPLQEFAQRLFVTLTDAHETLIDDEKRTRYIGIVRDGGGTPAAQRKLTQTIEATVEFQKAEALRKSDPSLAEDYARRAIALDPDQADYYALLAWILYERHAGEEAPLAEMLELVDKALGMHEGHDRAHYYRGAVLRRLGRERDAIRAFRKASTLNPRNVDALREVRLAEMRAKKSGTSLSGSTQPAVRPGAPTSDRPEKKSGGQRDIGEMFKGLFSPKKK